MKKLIAMIVLLGAQLALGMLPENEQKVIDMNNRLMGAIVAGNVQTVNDLLARGANPNAIDGNGTTALLAVFLQPHLNIDIVRALVAARADVNAVLPNGVTVLMLATTLGNVDAVTILLEAGANRDAVAGPGITALMNATLAPGGLPVVKKLLLFIPPAERKRIREHIRGLSSALKRTETKLPQEIQQIVGRAIDAIVEQQMQRISGLLAQTNFDDETAQVYARDRGRTAIANFLNPNNPELRQAVVEEIQRIIAETQMPPVAKK